MSYENFRPAVSIGTRVGSNIMISSPLEKEDPHHCRCFVIDEELKKFHTKLQNLDFGYQIFENNHGQVFGLTKRLDEYSQVHVKVMPNGEIESEIEPPPEYPGAHLDLENSYSAHRQVQEILQLISTPYNLKGRIPTTCIQPVIKKLENPTHITTIVAGVALVAVFAVAIVAVAKGSRS